jgi:hypothetical protein
MSIRGAHRVGRQRAQQTHPQAQLDAAVEPAAERAARPGSAEEAAAGPEMNRQERAIFTVYVVIGILIVLFLAATGVLWWLGG